MKPRQAFILSVLSVPAILGAQSNLVHLGSPDSTLDVFSRVVAVRVLADRKVIVADRREKRLSVVSFGGLPTRQIGRLGPGPGEFLAVGPLVPMDGDSTAMIDGAAGQWMLLKGVEPVGMMSPASLTVRAAHFPFGITPTHVYGVALPTAGLGATPHDSMAVIRVSRRDARVDTITLMAAPTARRAVDTTPNQKVITVHISIPMNTMGEQAALFDDGWLAVARLHPYRVDWIDPSGAVRPGQPLLEPGNDSTPPFTALADVLNDLAPALKKGPSGELLVRRVPTAAEPEQRYDVVERDGRVSSQIVMPPRETLVGVGGGYLFTVRTGEDGKEQLRRYPWTSRARAK